MRIEGWGVGPRLPDYNKRLPFWKLYETREEAREAAWFGDVVRPITLIVGEKPKRKEARRG